MSRSKTRTHNLCLIAKLRKLFSPFNSGYDLTDQLFVATIQICNELVFLCLQNHFVSVSIICGASRFAIIELKFNIKPEGFWVLGRSPDMTIRKVKKNIITPNITAVNIRCIYSFNKTLVLNVCV